MDNVLCECKSASEAEISQYESASIPDVDKLS